GAQAFGLCSGLLRPGVQPGSPLPVPARARRTALAAQPLPVLCRPRLPQRPAGVPGGACPEKPAVEAGRIVQFARLESLVRRAQPCYSEGSISVRRAGKSPVV